MPRKTMFRIPAAGVVLGTVLNAGLALVPVQAAVGAPMEAGGNTSSGAIRVDTATPVEADRVAADDRPRIAVQFVPGSVSPSAVRLEVNGADVTPQAEVDGSGIAFVPDRPLPEGQQRVVVRVGSESYAWTFVTATAPRITSNRPEEVTFPAGARPTITAEFSDVGSGIDPSRTRLFLLGGTYATRTDVTAGAEVTATGITFTPPESLAEGRYFVHVQVFDRAGNVGLGRSRSVFQVGDAPEILAIEPDPDEVVLPFGTPPLIRVRFDTGGGALRVHELSVAGFDAGSAELAAHGDGTYTARFLIPDPAPARHCFSLTVTNTKGLETSAARCFTIDRLRHSR